MRPTIEDYVFTNNCLTVIKLCFLDYDKTMEQLNKLKPEATNDLRKAFWQGGHDYVCRLCEIPYTVDETLILPDLVYDPGMYFSSAREEDFQYTFDNAIKQWLNYNIATLGCLQNC